MDKYFSMIEKISEKHILMLQFYKKINLMDWYNFVEYRHKLLIEDLKNFE